MHARTHTQKIYYNIRREHYTLECEIMISISHY